MATRYIGDAVVDIEYQDNNEYSGTITAGGQTWKFDSLYPPAIGFGRGVGYDSSRAYDEMARSAVSFGSYYTSHNRGDDTPDWAPPEKVADAIDEATGWAQDDQGTYEVRRSAKGQAREEMGQRQGPEATEMRGHAEEFTKSQHHYVNGWNQIEKGIRVWVSDGRPMRIQLSTGTKGREFAEGVVRSWWGSQALHFAWTDSRNADISPDYTHPSNMRPRGGALERHRTREAHESRVVHDYAALDRNNNRIAGPSKDYDAMKRAADSVGGVVTFVPSGPRPRRAPPPPSSYPMFREAKRKKTAKKRGKRR
jgi:hypothetical protein